MGYESSRIKASKCLLRLLMDKLLLTVMKANTESVMSLQNLSRGLGSVRHSQGRYCSVIFFIDAFYFIGNSL